jgi:hypothetical protein
MNGTLGTHVLQQQKQFQSDTIDATISQASNQAVLLHGESCQPRVEMNLLLLQLCVDDPLAEKFSHSLTHSLTHSFILLFPL